MEHEQAQELQALRQTAYKILRKGHTPFSQAIRIFQLLVFPSFANSVCIEMFQTQAEPKAYRLFQSIWKFDEDLHKFRTPVERLRYPRELAPTIESHPANRSTEALVKLAEELQFLQLPAELPKHAIGVDGTWYELTLGDTHLGVCYRWWETPPTEWKKLGEITQTIIEYIRDILDAR